MSSSVCHPYRLDHSIAITQSTLLDLGPEPEFVRHPFPAADDLLVMYARFNLVVPRAAGEQPQRIHRPDIVGSALVEKLSRLGFVFARLANRVIEHQSLNTDSSALEHGDCFPVALNAGALTHRVQHALRTRLNTQ